MLHSFYTQYVGCYIFILYFLYFSFFIHPPEKCISSAIKISGLWLKLRTIYRSSTAVVFLGGRSPTFLTAVPVVCVKSTWTCCYWMYLNPVK
ncbi:UNVERIFIED_CONTAM: hypothetical protein NCL1_40402 [Trichonephila clavipes]